jgi:hypothetical protein
MLGGGLERRWRGGGRIGNHLVCGRCWYLLAPAWSNEETGQSVVWGVNEEECNAEMAV